VRADLEKRLEALKSDLQFAPREVRLLEKAWIIGPVAGKDEEAMRASLLAGEIPANAQLSSEPFDFAALGLAAGDIFYVAVPLERLTPHDPFVTFEFITPGTFRKHGRPGVPFAAYNSGGLLWMNRAYAQTTGRPYQPGGLFNEKCNYPLGRKTSTAVFRGIAPPSLRAFQIEVQLPAGQARFLPENAEAAGGPGK